MSTHAAAAPAEARTEATAEKTRKSAGYVVLKEVTDPAELTEMASDGKISVYAIYRPHVDARDSSRAIREATVSENSVDEGVYVAVPKGSFKPKRVRQSVQVTLD